MKFNIRSICLKKQLESIIVTFVYGVGLTMNCYHECGKVSATVREVPSKIPQVPITF